MLPPPVTIYITNIRPGKNLPPPTHTLVDKSIEARRTVTVYIEPKYYKPLGICVGYYGQSVTTSTDLAGTRRVTVRAKDCMGHRVKVFIFPDDQDINCMECATGCSAAITPPAASTESNPRPSIPAPPSFGCASTCLSDKQIRWGEGFNNHSMLDVIDGVGNIGTVDYKKSNGTLVTRFKVPKICGLEAMQMTFEVSPCHAEWGPKDKKEIPLDNSLKYIYPEEWEIAWPYTDTSACFLPGESIIVTANIRKEDGFCRKMIVGFAWYETSCLTSGIIQGCGLISAPKQNVKEVIKLSRQWIALKNNHISNLKILQYQQIAGGKFSLEFNAANGWVRLPMDSWNQEGNTAVISYDTTTWTVLAGGNGEAFKDEWIGDPRLAWLVYFKGTLWWLKCSDFARFDIGERVYIHKSGLSQRAGFNNWRRCRTRDQSIIAEHYYNDNIVTDSDVSYVLDISRDVILPVRITP
jgi:hypothetical protein